MTVTEEMVEAAAKALFDRREDEKTNVNLRWAWGDFAEGSDTKTFWRKEARAALEAALSVPAQGAVKVTPRGGIERNWWEEYQLLLRQFKKLAKAARQCVEEVDANLANDDWPIKYRAPFGPLAKLREALPAAYEEFKSSALHSPAHSGEAESAVNLLRRIDRKIDNMSPNDTIDALIDGAWVELATVEEIRSAAYIPPAHSGERTNHLDGNRPLPFDRDQLGRMVREAWVRWAQTQPAPKPSWLASYDELKEPDKEADRQIGEAIARWTLIGDAARFSHSGEREALERLPAAFEVLDPENGSYLTRSEEAAIRSGHEYNGLYRRAALEAKQP